MNNEKSTDLPVRGASLIRMLVSLAAVGALLGYWASHQSKPRHHGLAVMNPMYCQCYDEKFPDIESTKKVSHSVRDSGNPLADLLPGVQAWLQSDPGRLASFGKPVKVKTSVSTGDKASQVSQWVTCDTGRTTRFWLVSGNVVGVERESPDGGEDVVWAAPDHIE